jgi:hypothetical protein
LGLGVQIFSQAMLQKRNIDNAIGFGDPDPVTEIPELLQCLNPAGVIRGNRVGTGVIPSFNLAAFG